VVAQVRAYFAASGSEFKIIRQVPALSRAHGGVSCTFLSMSVTVKEKIRIEIQTVPTMHQMQLFS